jgi:hypothetical protein
MTEHNDYHADPNHEDLFEREMRGYSRRRVDEFVAKTRSQVREMEDRLSETLDLNERLRLELSTVREASAEKPAHEEISERIGQILKLADDESKAQRNRADEEISKLRDDTRQETLKLREDAKAETDKARAEAQEQAERMLSAAQEQAENTVAGANAEADKARKAARSEAERAVGEATKQAESAVATAKAQAKQQLDEATARATAIHDGAERRLNLLMSRHTEAIRRLTEIRDVVTTLVAGEAARGSLEDEVARAVTASAQAESAPAAAPVGRPQAQGSAAHQNRGAQQAPPAGPVGRPAQPGSAQPGSAQPAHTSGAVQPTAAGQAPKAPVGSATRTAPTSAPPARPANGQHEGARHAGLDSDESAPLRGVRE